jgi:hypothetical protein
MKKLGTIVTIIFSFICSLHDVPLVCVGVTCLMRSGTGDWIGLDLGAPVCNLDRNKRQAGSGRMSS